MDGGTVRIAGNDATFEATWQAFKKSPLDATEQRLAEQYAVSYRAYLDQLMRPTIRAVGQGDYALAMVSHFLKGARDHGAKVKAMLDSLVEMEDRGAKQEYALAHRASSGLAPRGFPSVTKKSAQRHLRGLRSIRQ